MSTTAISPVVKSLAVRTLQEVCQSPHLNPAKMEISVVQARLNALKKIPREELHTPEDPVLRDIFEDALTESGVRVVPDDGDDILAPGQEEAEGNGQVPAAKPKRVRPKKEKAEGNGQVPAAKPKRGRPKKEKAEKKENPKTASKPKVERKPREGMSQMTAAVRVLRENRGHPMTAKAIVDKMAEKGYWKSPTGKSAVDTLASHLYQEIKHKAGASRFAQPAKGLFALTEVGKQK